MSRCALKINPPISQDCPRLLTKFVPTLQHRHKDSCKCPLVTCIGGLHTMQFLFIKWNIKTRGGGREGANTFYLKLYANRGEATMSKYYLLNLFFEQPLRVGFVTSPSSPHEACGSFMAPNIFCNMCGSLTNPSSTLCWESTMRAWHMSFRGWSVPNLHYTSLGMGLHRYQSHSALDSYGSKDITQCQCHGKHPPSDDCT